MILSQRRTLAMLVSRSGLWSFVIGQTHTIQIGSYSNQHAGHHLIDKRDDAATVYKGMFNPFHS